MRKDIRAFRHCARGAAAIEFAIIVPVMLLLAGGITEFGRYYSVSGAANRLATQYAGAWADCSDTTAGKCAAEVNTFVSANVIQNIAPELTASRTSLSMFQVSMNGTTPTVMNAYPTGSVLSASQTSAATSALKSGQIGVVVTVNYQHSLDYFSSVMSPFLGSLLSISYTVAQLKN